MVAGEQRAKREERNFNIDVQDGEKVESCESRVESPKSKDISTRNFGFSTLCMGLARTQNTGFNFSSMFGKYRFAIFRGWASSISHARKIHSLTQPGQIAKHFPSSRLSRSPPGLFWISQISLISGDSLFVLICGHYGKEPEDIPHSVHFVHSV